MGETMKNINYSTVKYGYIHFSKGFLIAIGLALVLFMGAMTMQFTLPEEFSLIASLGTFIYGFFTFAYMSFIQVKFINFKTLFAELNGAVKAFYDTALATDQEKPIGIIQQNLVAFLTTLKNSDAADFESSQEVLKPLVQATTMIEKTKFTDTNNHFNLLLGLNKICDTREKLSVFGTRYLLGELRIVFVTFTAILVAILVGVANTPGIPRILSLFLIYVVIFSMFYVFHLDRMSYSEQVVKNTTLDQTIEYIKTHKEIQTF